jgi:hypothetical protein
MKTRNQPIYANLVDAVLAREHSVGVTSLPGSRDTAVKACLASTDYALFYAAKAASKFGLDVCLQLEGEHVTGLPGLPVSRRGLEMAAAVLADVHLREREGNGGPDGGSPTWSGNIDDYLLQMTKPGEQTPDPNDPGGGAGAGRPVEYEYRQAA